MRGPNTGKTPGIEKRMAELEAIMGERMVEAGEVGKSGIVPLLP